MISHTACSVCGRWTSVHLVEAQTVRKIKQLGVPESDGPLEPLRERPKTIHVDRHKRRKGAVWQPPDTRNYCIPNGTKKHIPGKHYAHWLVELRDILLDPQYDGRL